MNNEQLFVKLALDNWHAQIKRADTLFDTLTDEQLQQATAPGRSRGIYLLGHLTAVHDILLPLLRFEEQRYPELREAFVVQPDNAAAEFPSISELKAAWKTVNEKLAAHFERLTPAEWLERHNSVSPEDFEKEPHRNRLNVLHSRTNHLAHHYGQLVYLK